MRKVAETNALRGGVDCCHRDDWPEGNSETNFEALGNLGDFVGGVGVVVTLAYLAVQIRTNTRAIRSTLHHEMVAFSQRLNETLTDHPDMARLLIKGRADSGGLSPEEQLRFDAYADRFFGTFENVFYQHSQGVVDDHMWEAWASAFEAGLSPAAYSFWKRGKHRYLPAFQAYVDSLDPSPADAA